MKILVVDDSRVMRQIVIRTLRQSGHGGHDVVEDWGHAVACRRCALCDRIAHR